VTKTYQGTPSKSKQKFEVIGKRELMVEVPLPMVEVWEELQTQVEQLTGHAGLRIIVTILEDEVSRRVGPPHRPDPASSGVRWGRQPGYVVFGGQKVAIPRPRVRTREGEEVALDSYARLQHDGRRQRAVREGILAGLTTRNYHRAVESVLEGYGIEKSSVSREFVQASAAQLQELCERKLDELELVALLIDGIAIGKQVLVVALGCTSLPRNPFKRCVSPVNSPKCWLILIWTLFTGSTVSCKLSRRPPTRVVRCTLHCYSRLLHN
jgi:hypothetical protein